MSSTQNPYVSTALIQDFNSEQQTRARSNIGAASSADLSTLAESVAAPATANPVMDGTAAVGASSKYAREDHVHPSDTSREAVTNKTTVVLGTSDSQYPTDKAVADFVNSSIATNTAHYISDDGDPFTSVAQLEAYTGTVTNNDYAFVTGVDSAGNTYYDRYKATVDGSTVTWALEYRLNNSSFTAAQWSAINSGITAALVSKIHEHSNKSVLDGITSTNISNWNAKMDRASGATAGDVATLDANGNVVDSGKTLGKSVPSDAVFTDMKVTQTKNNTSTIEYPLLMAGTTDPNGTATSARYDEEVKLNPSTNTISANISGNAATADLASATSSGQIPKEADLNSYNTANRNYQCNADNSSTVTNKPSGASGAFELEVIRGTGSTCVQIYYSRDDVSFNYIRKCTGLNDGTWTGWVKLIDSDDIKKPVVRGNVPFSATSTTETTSTWTSPTISSPSGGNAMMMYSIYVQGPSMTESDKWDVKINGSNWTTGIRGNFSSYACVVPASGVTFTVTGPYGIVAPRISYVLFQEWS